MKCFVYLVTTNTQWDQYATIEWLCGDMGKQSPPINNWIHYLLFEKENEYNKNAK